MSPQTYHVATFGCQMNARDSERIAGMLAEMGYSPAGGEEDADVVVYNTCCVRGHAESRVFGRLGYLKHLKAKRRGMRVVLCGCMFQQAAAAKRIRNQHPYVDVVLGTFNLRKLPELLRAAIETDGQIIDIWQTHDDWDEILPESRKYPNKAGVNIMYGCDNYCAYCVVPYVRGRERSREPRLILEEVERLLADGVQEITLLGQNVNSYGRGLDAPVDFARLLRMVAGAGAPRVKFLTSHPKDLSDAVINAIAETENLCKFIHLPAQSGSTEILRRMNRGYTREDYLRLVGKIRAAMPDASITTDLIVGFPNETEDDFRETLALCEQVRFNGAFTFIYSKRDGTPAAKMGGQIPHETVTERFKRLLDTVNPIVYDYNRKREGQTVRVLPESDAPDAATGLYRGRTEDNTLTHYSDPLFEGVCGEAAGGRTGWIDVRVTAGKPFYLLGEAVWPV